MNEKGVVFDLDGVLIDSMPFHYEAWREAFLRFGIGITRDEIYEREGEKRSVTACEIYQKHKGGRPDPSLERAIIETKDEIYKNIFRVEFIPGAKELLQTLRGRGVKLALATGATGLPDLFQQHPRFLQTFDVIVDGDDPKQGKPAPDPYLMALDGLGVSRNSCYVVENAPLGIQSAVAAGLKCLAVLGSSPLSEEALKSAGAAYVAKDMHDLAKRLLAEL